jgi:hypothetical protein
VSLRSNWRVYEQASHVMLSKAPISTIHKRVKKGGLLGCHYGCSVRFFTEGKLR